MTDGVTVGPSDSGGVRITMTKGMTVTAADMSCEVARRLALAMTALATDEPRG